MELQGFCGGTAVPISKSINTERTMNLIVESDPGTPKRNPTLQIRMALEPWTCIAPGPVRQLFYQDGRMFGVSGLNPSWYYEIFQSRQVTQRGQMTGDTRPAAICTNGSGGQQNMIVSGGNGYIHTLDTNAFVQITDSNFNTPSAWALYFETYFLSLQRDTNTFQLSEQLDGLNWNGLDTGQCSLTSDHKIAMALTSRTLMFAGQKNIEPWYNSGNASFPIQPESGVVIEHGIDAPYSFVNLDNTLYWIGRDVNGSRVVWRFNGYTPEKISTPPIDNILRQWPTVDDALAFSFQFNGHAFYCIYSRHNDTTLVYDVTTNLWVEFCIWDPVLMRDKPWPIRCAVTAWNGDVFVGSSNSVIIYKVVMGTYTDEAVL